MSVESQDGGGQPSRPRATHGPRYQVVLLYWDITNRCPPRYGKVAGSSPASGSSKIEKINSRFCRKGTGRSQIVFFGLVCPNVNAGEAHLVERRLGKSDILGVRVPPLALWSREVDD